MIAYGYEPITGEYTGEVNAWASPLEPGEFLLPALATFVEPPATQEGKFRKWNGSAWVYEDIPQPPLPVAPTTEFLSAEVRSERNGLLVASDFTQLPDVPIDSVNKAEWAVYRQALRDVPQQVGFPQEVTWPQMPS